MPLFQPNDLSRAARFAPVGERGEPIARALCLAHDLSGPLEVSALDETMGVVRVRGHGIDWLVKLRVPSLRAALVDEATRALALRAAGLPVPEVVLPRASASSGAARRSTPLVEGVVLSSGAGPSDAENARVALVERFVVGERFTGAPGELDSAVRVFAALTFAADALPALPLATSPLLDGARLAREARAGRAAKNERLSRLLVAHAEVLERALSAVGGRSSADEPRHAMEALERTVHLDFHPANLLFRDGALACVLDLEDLCRYPLVPALGFAAFKLIREALVGQDDPGRAGPALLRAWCERWNEAVAVGAPDRAEAHELRLSTAALAAGARYRVLVLVQIIVGAALAGDERSLYDLEKQLTSLEEIEVIASPENS